MFNKKPKRTLRHRIAYTSTCQQLLQRFMRRIAQWMAAGCSFILLSTAFVLVCPPSCSEDGSGFLILPLVNRFHSLRTVLLCRRLWIPHSSTHQWLSHWIARRIAQRISTDCSFFCWSMAFTVCVPFAEWMAAYCSFFRLSMAFTVYAPFCSADDCRLLILPLVNGFHDSFHTILFSRWPRIIRSSACQCLSWFAPHFAQRMVAHCSFFHVLMAFTVCAHYCSPDGGELHILILFNGFHERFHAVLLNRCQHITGSFDRL